MSPIDRCHAAFTAHGVDFAAALERNYREGFVFSTPDYFVMGRPHERGNMWFVEGMSGDCAKVWDILPWPLGHIAFYRFDKELHIVPSEALRRLSTPTHEMAQTA